MRPFGNSMRRCGQRKLLSSTLLLSKKSRPMNPRPQRIVEDRAFQLLLVVSTLALSWLGMMVVHEFGHVLFSQLSGGTIAKVVLHPVEFSRTDLATNPHPLLVAWGGALVGVGLPLTVAALWRLFRWPAWFVVQF